MRNVETASSENNYKIIVSEAANSQKRALLKTIVGIIVGIVKNKNNKTYTTQGIQPLLYFLPFRPNIAVKRKANHCFQWLAFFVLNFTDISIHIHHINIIF
ncbi:MAG: hypothetical protein L0G63_07730 [Psychrobacter sp.]|uniref:hypothetical protein n=1 Tax=Psychrobacter sp. TaxID=56811 RepID=UPI0026471136|nr:hypothetical protein [Psychrobacter sp.]MDN5620350.1 hypothetical protein [Psychrobacter sp.]